MIQWTDIDPKDAIDIDLSKRLDITAPHNELGERCPWPWDPQQLVGAPIGQYHCKYCGAMIMAGMPHIDYKESEEPLDVTKELDTSPFIEASDIPGAGLFTGSVANTPNRIDDAIIESSNFEESE